MTAHKPPTRLSRSLTLTLLTGLTLAAGRPASAQTGIEPLDTLPPGLGGNDFLVDLSSVANAEGTLTFPAEYVKVRNIPFRIARPGQGGHLFLKPIGWSDWETDPSGYTAAYDRRPAKPDPARAMVEIPVDDYRAVYLLAHAEDDEALSNLMTLRIGVFAGPSQTTIEDVPITVPRSGVARVPAGATAVAVGDNPRLFVLQVPLNRNFMQLYPNRNAIDVDITKEVRLAIRRPDPNRYNLRPLGLPSGVRIYGMTFRRSGVRMTVTGRERDQVFVAPDVPAFDIALDRVTRGRLPAAGRNRRGVTPAPHGTLTSNDTHPARSTIETLG